MADLITSYANDNTLTNVGVNFNKFAISTSDAGRTLIVSASKTDITNAELAAAIAQLTLAGGDGTGTDTGGPDAFTIAGVGTATGVAFVSGTTDVVYLRVQGTGTPNLTTIGGVVLAKVCEFAPAL
jgi:hypothetical protein